MAKRVFKTARQLSGGNQTYRKWAEWEVGDVFIGKYLETHIDKYDKDAWVFKVEEAQFKSKKANEAVEGKNLVLNSAGMLDKAMRKLQPGAIVQITFNGKSEMETGKYAGKESYSFQVDELVEDDGAGELDEDDL